VRRPNSGLRQPPACLPATQQQASPIMHRLRCRTDQKSHELGTQSAPPRLRLSHLRSRSRPDWATPARFVPECLAHHPSQTSSSVYRATSAACTSIKLLRLRSANTWSVAAKASPGEAQAPRHPPGTVMTTRTLWRNAHCQGGRYLEYARL
jgi:hypothetical protein